MSKFDDIDAFENVAHHVKEFANSFVSDPYTIKKVHKRANEALKHVATARQLAAGANNSQNSGGITQALDEASQHITAAHQLVRGTMGMMNTPSTILEVSDLGKTREMHDSALEDMNEGLKNGR